MAVFGVQLVFSMISASILAKILPHCSFARWILCNGLVRYLFPTEEEIRASLGPPASLNGKRNRKGRGPQTDNGPLMLPKNIDIQLEASPVTVSDILPLHYYAEYQWLIDFSVCGCLVYVLTEIYYATWSSGEDFNLSMVWCTLLILFSIKILGALTGIYFSAEGFGEGMICLIMGFFFLVLSMGALIVNEDILDFGLDKAYMNFTAGAQAFLEKQDIHSTGLASLITFKIVLAFVSALTGAFLTFPGLRLAKMHLDSVKYAANSPMKGLLLHLNVALPALIILLWLKPIAHRLLPRASDDDINLLRIYVILFICLFRLLFVRTYLQAHLNMAVDRVQALKKEAGKISSLDFQRLVIRVFYYLCVVALQYLAPLILLIYCALLFKTLGGLSWLGAADGHWSVTSHSRPESATRVSLALANLREVFTVDCFRGMFSYFCWWLNTALFCTTMFGLGYHNYFGVV